MSVLIVGADQIDAIRREIESRGMSVAEHWTGRKTGDLRRAFPEHLSLVVVMTDFVGHGLVTHIRTEASRHGVPVIYCHRSLTDVRVKLDRMTASQRRAA